MAASTMKNDIDDRSAPFGSSEVEQMQQIVQFQVERSKAYLWAFRDCKFLVFDDTDPVNGKGKEKATELLPGQGLGEGGCRICSSCPEFPHDRKTRRLRLFRPRDAFPRLQSEIDDNCFHYVAVSYCWPARKLDNNGKAIEVPRTYQIRELDGNVRENRALDDVIDRAIDVANSFGLRMIWIDQECLPQPAQNGPPLEGAEKEEQQIGIQAMDILYQRAVITAGLHDLELSSQPQVDAMRFAIDRQTGGEHEFDLLLDFLDQVCKDRWYTRAWVVQEALSAGRRLVLVFRRGSGISYKSQFHFKQQHLKVPPHSLDSGTRGLESEAVCLPVNQFRRIVREAKDFIEGRAFTPGLGGLVGHPPSDPIVRGRVPTLIRDAEALHPAVIEDSMTTSLLKMEKLASALPGGQIWKRDRMDAAGALTLLKKRGCQEVKDRIAIVANMCGYELRLDINAVERHCNSLRVALLALSIMNGDLSLLVPEIYATPSLGPEARTMEARSSPYWFDPFDTHTRRINHVQVREFCGPRVAQPLRDGSRLFKFKAYIWTVEDMIDLTPVKLRWAEDWGRLQCLQIATQKSAAETDDAYQIRRKLIYEHLTSPEVNSRVVREVIETGSLAEDSDVWGDIDHTGARVFPYLVLDHIQAEKGRQDCIARIFFDILRCLLNQADTDPRAAGVANSIWQCMRVSDERLDSMDLPDHVSEALFHHPHVVSNPFRTLQFRKGQNGQFDQLWLFTRIMATGTLWVGRYKRSTNPASFVPHNSVRNSRLEPIFKSFGLKNPFDWVNSRELRDRVSPSGRGTEVDEASLQSILGQQILQQVTSCYAFTHELQDLMRASEARTPPHVMTAASLGNFQRAIQGGTFSFSEEERRTNTLVSVFDVDGPCVMATVYNPEWEMLPLPDMRRMSVCWVVEDLNPLGGTPDDAGFVEQLLRHQDEFRNHGPRVGEPRLTPSEVYALEHGIMAEPVDSPADLMVLGKRYSETRRAYKVVNKVRGMWQVMEVPSQFYTFV